MTTPNTDDELAGELLAALHEVGALQQELAGTDKLVSELLDALRGLLPVADHENLSVGGKARIDAAETLIENIEKITYLKRRAVLDAPAVRPHIIPFGGGVILTGSVVSAEVATFLIRACRDGYHEGAGKTPKEAWDASQGAPEWWLAFTDPADIIGVSDQLNTLAHDMMAARSDAGMDGA